MKELFYVSLVAMTAIVVSSPIANIINGLQRPTLLVFLDDPKQANH